MIHGYGYGQLDTLRSFLARPHSAYRIRLLGFHHGLFGGGRSSWALVSAAVPTYSPRHA